MTRMGRPSIFIPKDGGKAYHILSLTKEGRKLFERARVTLRRLARWKGRVSDADVVEFALRGEAATVDYLKAKERSNDGGK